MADYTTNQIASLTTRRVESYVVPVHIKTLTGPRYNNLRELVITSRMSRCKYAAEMIDSYECDDTVVMVFYMYSCTLISYIGVPRPVDKLLRMFKTAMYGLEYMHRCGIAHMDVKPENIMIDCDRDRARIIDFGASCSFAESPYARYDPNTIPIGVQSTCPTCTDKCNHMREIHWGSTFTADATVGDVNMQITTRITPRTYDMFRISGIARLFAGLIGNPELQQIFNMCRAYMQLSVICDALARIGNYSPRRYQRADYSIDVMLEHLPE